MNEVYVVSAVRSPVGRRGGGLSAVHPADLAGHVLSAAVARAGVDPEVVDDVILGCVGQIGAQTGNIARTAWLSADLPEGVPGTTIDRQCGSSQQAVHFAAQAIRAGDQDIVVAGGVEVMSLVPIASPVSVGGREGMGFPLSGDGWIKRYGEQEVSQFRGAELIAERWNVSRHDMEVLALASHERAVRGEQSGVFGDEIVPYGEIQRDECPRPDTSLERMASLAPIVEGGRLTAAVSSAIADGAAALVLASKAAIDRYGLTPLARIHATTVVGSDPILMLTGPIKATQDVLRKGKLSVGDIDHFEVNEAFASVVLAWARETSADLAKTNPLGGAISQGHPLGATGAKLMTTMVHNLHRTGGRYGLQVMCEGGGMANATILERA